MLVNRTVDAPTVSELYGGCENSEGMTGPSEPTSVPPSQKVRLEA